MELSRRQLIGAGLATAAGVASREAYAAVVPKKPSVGNGEIGPQLKLSCCAYSLRDYLPHDGKPGKITMLDWLDLAAAWKLDGVELTSYYFESEDPKYMYALKAKAFKLGLDVSGTAVGNNFVVPPGDERDKQIGLVKRWIDHAVELGAPCIRIFAGGKPGDADRKRDFGWVVECIKGCTDYAASHGVFLALENHGYLTETAQDVLDIVEAVNHDWLGVNLDTGNFVADPYGNIDRVAPKVITAHAKTEVRTSDGKGTEPADHARIARILRNANYRGYLSLEYEANEDAMVAVPTVLEKIRCSLTG
jgi:sugar phosphate isomerase/epimerase